MLKKKLVCGPCLHCAKERHLVEHLQGKIDLFAPGVRIESGRDLAHSIDRAGGCGRG